MKILYISIVCTMLHINVVAQEVWHTYINKENTDITTAICNDKKGNMWIGTNTALHKYDGIAWKSYPFFECENPFTWININKIYAEDDVIWVLTCNGLILKLEHEKYTYYQSGIGVVPIFSIAKSMCYDKKNNKRWFVTNNGVKLLINNTWNNYTNYYFYTIQNDKNDQLWVTTYKGVAKFDGDTSFEYIDTAKQYITESSDLLKIFFGNDNTLYITNNTDTVIQYRANNFERIKIKTAENTFIANEIVQDTNNNLWISSINNGIVKYDGANFTTYNTSNSNINSNYIFSLNIDNKQQVWAGTFMNTNSEKYLKEDALCILKNNTWYPFKEILTSPVDNTILDIAVDKNNNKWFATESGISNKDSIWSHYNVYTDGFQLQNQVFIRYTKDEKILQGRSNSYKNTFYNLYNSYKLNIVPQLKNTFLYNNQQKIFIDKNYAVWSKQDNSSKLICTTSGTDNLVDSTTYNIVNNNITNILQDNKENIWLVHANYGTNTIKGFSVYNGISWTWLLLPDTFGGATYYSIDDIKYQDNSIWFSTNHGILKYESSNFYKYDVTNSPLVSNKVYCSFVKGNTIYFAADSAIYKIQNQTWEKYNARIYSNNNNKLMCVDNNNSIWYIQGIYTIRISENTIDTFFAKGLYDTKIKMPKNIYYTEDSVITVTGAEGYATFKNNTWNIVSYYTHGLPDTKILKLFVDDNATPIVHLQTNSVLMMQDSIWKKYVYKDSIAQVKNYYCQKNNTQWYVLAHGIVFETKDKTIFFDSTTCILKPTMYAILAEDNNHKMYFLQNHKIITFDGIKFEEDNFTFSFFTTKNIKYLTFDKQNRALVATTDSKVFQQQNNSSNNYYEIAPVLASSIAVDNFENIWLSTRNGLVKIKNNTTYTYTTTNSKLVCNNVIKVVVDSIGNKWIITNNGVNELIDYCNTNTITLQKKEPNNNSNETIICIDINPKTLYNYQIKWFVNNQLYTVTSKNSIAIPLHNTSDEVYAILTPLEECYTFDSLISNKIYVQHSSNDILIFPNPTSDVFSVVTDNIIENTPKVLELYSSLGTKIVSKIFTEPSTTINVKGISKGVYIVKITATQKQWTKKIIIE